MPGVWRNRAIRHFSSAGMMCYVCCVCARAACVHITRLCTSTKLGLEEFERAPLCSTNSSLWCSLPLYRTRQRTWGPSRKLRGNVLALPNTENTEKVTHATVGVASKTPVAAVLSNTHCIMHHRHRKCPECGGLLGPQCTLRGVWRAGGGPRSQSRSCR